MRIWRRTIYLLRHLIYVWIIKWPEFFHLINKYVICQWNQLIIEILLRDSPPAKSTKSKPITRRTFLIPPNFLSMVFTFGRYGHNLISAATGQRPLSTKNF